MSDDLGFIPIKRRTGDEFFHQGGKSINADLVEFWQWSRSDLLGNTDRGVLAEFIVALDLGLTGDFSGGWHAYDLETRDGIKIEVKSAAYVQTWKQKRHSRLNFGIAPKLAWDPLTDEFDKEKRRNSEVYVFCVLAHKDQVTIDPLDLDQWEFYVLATSILNEHVPTQKTIGLPALQKMGAVKVRFGEIGRTVREALTRESEQ